MMAQLTEETQPSFETTLKSKAVSENCNVKFSCVVTGYPAPQVTWYKDDMQLDRYCGLPKYEIFRNGQSHSLHIYNCTVEDAAIYQASAINSKGIVSCSGVLEVGEMNEFKIHQRYFAKLKQKAENRRREAEGKENQEPLRTISPDRTQRKRRSTMEAFLSTPSSTEDEGGEENHQAVAVETEARLQEAAVETAEEKPAPATNGAVSAITNGQAVSDSGSKAGTYIYDSSQKIFTAHQPKTPFVKKKIKISNSVKVAKADAVGERVCAESRAKEETSVSLACAEAVQSVGNSEEVMEVEDIVNPSVVHSDLRNVSEEHQKSRTEESMLTDRSSKDENICTEEPAPSQKQQLPAAPAPTRHTVAGSEGENAAKHQEEAGRSSTEETQNRTLCTTLRQPQSNAASSILKEDIHTTEQAMDVDVKSTGSLAEDTPCDRRTASPQLPCEPAGDQLSGKETSPCQKKAPLSRPALPSEVTQAHTKMNRNDAPVSLELPPDWRTNGSQLPQKTATEREAMTEDIQTSSLGSALQSAVVETPQDTRDHSRELNESHVVLFTHLQKSPLESPRGGENTRGCTVSPTIPQRQVDTAIKTVEGTEIQDDEKVKGHEVGKLSVQTRSVAPNEKIVEMETETATLRMIEQSQKEKTKDAGNKETGAIVGEDASCKKSERKEPVLKVMEETSSELQNCKSDKFTTALPLLTKMPENPNSLENMISFQEIPKPATKVVSVAELLRSQIKALDSTLVNTLSTVPAHTSLAQDPAAAKPETRTDHAPPTNITATLMEVYHQLHTSDEEQIQTQGATPSPAQALQQPPVIPHISVIDTTTGDITGLHGNTKNYHEGVMDVSQETGASTPPKDFSVFLRGSKNVKDSFPPLTSENKLTKSNLSGTISHTSGSPLTLTQMKVSTEEPDVTVLKETKGEPAQDKNMEFIQKLTPEIKLNSKTESVMTEMNLTTLSDQCKMEQHHEQSSFLQRIQKFPTDSELSSQENNLPLIQQSSSMVEECLRSDSLSNPTPEPSPSLKRRNCVSPIPSATPQELASGARRKILTPKAKPEEAAEASSPVDNQTQKKEVPAQSSKRLTSSVTAPASSSPSRLSPLPQTGGEQTPPAERRSPLVSRRKTPSVTQTPTEESQTEAKPAEKDKYNPFKAPQVIRKIRAETFADASGHLKLWCQFFNVLSDSTVTWYRNEEEIAQVKRNAGDETQVNMAIVQASCKDAGVYGCSIANEYGTDSTDILLSAEIMAGLSLREDLGVGEEIEMTPLIFSKGVADSGVWGNKFFGRIMMKESQIGDGCSHKVWRAKVIYGLEPVFESGHTCIVKVCNPIAYGGKEESCLIDRNLDIVRQECKIQNLAREYCKIFSAEARVIENFGATLEVIPVYLMYRPANTVPYATVEADLTGVYQKYSALDHAGKIDTRTGSEVEQKCCALQHWIFQWTNGNLLLTRLEGVDSKITNVGISVKSTGHQGLSVEGNPKVFEQFISQHKCNYFCGLLGLRSLKVLDSLMTPTKSKGSRSPLLQRKMAAGSSSPQTGRKAAGSPRLPRKSEQDGSKMAAKQKAADAPKDV